MKTAVTLFLALLAALVAAQPVPATPARTMLSRLLGAIGKQDYTELSKLYGEMGRSAPGDQAAQDLHYFSKSGELIVRKLVSSEERSVEAIAQAAMTGLWYRMSVRLPAQEGRPVALGLAQIPRPDEFVPAAKLSEAQLSKAIDKIVSKAIAEGRFSGSVVVARNGKPIYRKAAGFAHEGFKVPNRVDTKFNLASCGKMFTAVAIGQLVDAGKLTFETKVGELLPDYPNEDVRSKVTVHQLLTHTSGLGDIFNAEYMGMSKDRLRTVSDYVSRFSKTGLLFEPGTDRRYSNYGFIVLGAIIEKVSGMDYWEYLQKSVFDRVGMKATGAFEMDFDTPNLAFGYEVQGGRLMNNLFIHVVRGTPAGGAFSTAEDMVKFADALETGKLVTPAVYRTLTTQKVPGYGYGFGLRTMAGKQLAGHNGGFFGISAELTIHERGYTVAAFANRGGQAQTITMRINELIAQEMK